jgi:hypothetical protein
VKPPDDVGVQGEYFGKGLGGRKRGSGIRVRSGLLSRYEASRMSATAIAEFASRAKDVPLVLVV